MFKFLFGKIIGFSVSISSICVPCRGYQNLKVSDIINEYRHWNKELLSSIVPSNICQAIYSLFLPRKVDYDKLIWGLS